MTTSRMSTQEVKARKQYHLHQFYRENPQKWRLSGGNVICKCRRGYGSPLDGLCRFCRGVSARTGYSLIMEHLVRLPRSKVHPEVDFKIWDATP